MIPPGFFALESGSPSIADGHVIHDIGLVNDHGEFEDLLNAGDKIPLRAAFQVRAASASQPFVAVTFYARESPSSQPRQIADLRIPCSEPGDRVEIILFATEGGLAIRTMSSSGEPLEAAYANAH